MERAFGRYAVSNEAPGALARLYAEPGNAAEGMERNAYLAHKFGSGQRAIELYDVIARTGLEEGILFAFGSIARTPSSMNAHRLIRHAGTPARQNEVYASCSTDTSWPARISAQPRC